MLEDLNLDAIKDENALISIRRLLNIIEDQQKQIREVNEKYQKVIDELNRLKGEQGKPDIKPSTKGNSKGKNKNISSEKERNKSKRHSKKSKKREIPIDREEKCEVKRDDMPSDVQFKGYVEVVVQDLKIISDNILFLKEKFYSPSLNKTFLASVPNGFEGDYGPGVKSQIIEMYFACNMSEPLIHEYLKHHKIEISIGQISNILIKGKTLFHNEKTDLYKAGLASSPWHHIDDTGARVNGENQYCNIICNPLYTAYFTTPTKNRLNVISILQNLCELKYLINIETLEYLNIFKLPAYVFEQLQHFPSDQELTEKYFISLVEKYLPNLGKQHRSRFLESAAISFYHSQEDFPVIQLFLCDDAPQFKLVTEELGLCWIHDGRHYKKLNPCIPHHQKALDAFLERFWEYYKRLLSYRSDPTEEMKKTLSGDFDELFSTVTKYDELDLRIAKSKEKKSFLLMVLEHSEIPLHNNPAEIEVRRRVRKRDISFGTRTSDGTRAWDTFQTILATTKKLGICFYEYIYDRVSMAFKMPSLAQLIKDKAETYNLGRSWEG